MATTTSSKKHFTFVPRAIVLFVLYIGIYAVRRFEDHLGLSDYPNLVLIIVFFTLLGLYATTVFFRSRVVAMITIATVALMVILFAPLEASAIDNFNLIAEGFSMTNMILVLLLPHAIIGAALGYFIVKPDLD